MAARGRAGAGTTGYAVALVIMVVFFLGALVWAIIEFTQLSGYATETKDANDKVAILDRDRKAFEDQNKALKKMLTGDGNASFDEIQKRFVRTKDTPAGNPYDAFIAENETLVGKMGGMSADLTRTKADLDAARNELARLQDERKKAQDAMNASQEATKAEVDSLKGRLAAIDTANSASSTKADQARTELEKSLEKSINDGNARAADLQKQLDSVNAELASAKGTIDRLKGIKGNGPTPPNPVTMPDGQIVSVVSGQPLVYINRGRANHVTPGLTFAVFSRGDPITFEEGQTAAGKATIEVVQVGEQSSTARVVRLDRGQAIGDGDQIANAVYDPNQHYKFQVYGKFDIENSGVVSEADTKRVQAMITEWGGKLTDKLDYDTDFLVLGKEPEAPAPLKDQSDPGEVAKYALAQAEYRKYQELIGQATALKIPILNQNRFLALVGYYQR